MTRCSKGGDWTTAAIRRPTYKCQQPCVEGSMYCAEHRTEALERVRAILKKPVERLSEK